MEPLPLLLIYSVALLIFALAGGLLPRRIEMTHTRTQLAMSLVSGLMLGVAFFHLLPHAVLTLGIEQGLNSAMAWVILGLVVMLLLLRLLHFHQPDLHQPDLLSADPQHGDSSHRDSHECPHEREFAPQGGHLEIHGGAVSWKGVLVGLGFHTFIDGIALGAAFLSSAHGHSQELLGFGVFLAILLHRPLDAMSITALMKGGGASISAQRWANTVFALLCPLGALGFYFFAIGVGDVNNNIVASALAFSAGSFICIALSDLLPEVQFHSHDRLKLTGVFLFGIALSYLLANAASTHSHAI